MSDGPSEAELDAAIRLVRTVRETVGEMISAGAIPERVAATIGAVLGEAIMRVSPGAEAQLIHQAVDTAASFLTAHGRPVPLLVGTAELEDGDEGEVRH